MWNSGLQIWVSRREVIAKKGYGGTRSMVMWGQLYVLLVDDGDDEDQDGGGERRRREVSKRLGADKSKREKMKCKKKNVVDSV